MTLYVPKDWKDSPNVTTPLSAAAIEDLETRVTDYADLQAGVTYGVPSPTGTAATDTANIQAEITACSAAGGGVVRLQAGTYAVTTINLASDVTIWGPGATLEQETGQTLPILYHAQTANNPIQDGDLLTNVTIRDLSFIGETGGAEAARAGILIGQGTDIRVENCKFTNIRSSAVNCAHCLRVWYIDNYAYNCASSGRNVFDMWAGGFSDSTARSGIFVATGNTVITAGAGGIVTTSATGGADLEFRAVIANNYIEDCGWAGVALESGQGSRASVVTGNRIKNCYVGVQMADNESAHGATPLIERNVVANNYINSTVTSSQGIATDGAKNVAITGNVVRCKGNRIKVSNDSDTSIRANDVVVSGNVLENGNTVNSNLTYALWVVSTDGVVVANNRITNVGTVYGLDDMYIWDVTDATVVGNSSYLACRYGILVEECTDALIEGNSVKNPGTAAGSYGIILGGSANTDVHVRGNHVGDTRGGGSNMVSGLGFSTTTCTRVTAEGNSIHGQSAAPIYGPAKLARANGNYTDESASVASGATVDLPQGHDVITITGTADITSITASWPTRQVTLVFSGTAATNGLVDGSNLKLASTLAYTPDDAITLVCNGTNWYQAAPASVN